MTEVKYISVRIVNGKPKQVIVEKSGKIINSNPGKNELKGLKIEKYKISRPNKYYTNEKLLEHLKRFYEENGRIPEMKDFTNNPVYPGKSIYALRFGSWSNALKLVDLEFTRKNIYTDNELLISLKNFVYDFKRIPTKTDFENNPFYPCSATYQKRFGSWSNALKIAKLDVDSMVKNGIIETNQQKARLAEIKVINHFKDYPTDLSGENQNSPFDGICPNKLTYDVKSSGLHLGGYWTFNTNNKFKDEIEIYYFLGFNENFTKLEHGWRIPTKILEIDKDSFYVSSYSRSCSGFNIKNLYKYDITNILNIILTNK